ncbi:MAG TPA: zinc ribbon domain-containing protein [Bryobacteraceae bacterium]|nr:zinc ribbon domain-containing protein [Bryobacteraceae bacterium]
MAFCTNCGAEVAGAFCSQCGTPVASASASAPPPPPPPAPASYPQMAAPGAPPPVRRTSPIVWVLVIVLGLFVLGGISVAAFVAFIGHRLHQAGVSFDRNGNGAITLHARDRNGNAVMEIGGKGKLPSWVPVYPGSESRATFSIRGTGSDGGEGGNFTFTTPDDPDRVKTFYSDKIRDLGMKVNVDTSTPEGGMIVAAEEGADQRSLSIVVGGGHSGETTVNVTYGRK